LAAAAFKLKIGKKRSHLQIAMANFGEDIVQRLSSTYQAYCALFDKSTKIGIYTCRLSPDKNSGYGGTPKYPHGGHSNRFKMAALKFYYFSLKRTSLFHNSS